MIVDMEDIHHCTSWVTLAVRSESKMYSIFYFNGNFYRGVIFEFGELNYCTS